MQKFFFMMFILMLVLMAGCSNTEQKQEKVQKKDANLYANLSEREQKLTDQIEKQGDEIMRKNQLISEQRSKLKESAMLKNKNVCNKEECLFSLYNSNFGDYDDNVYGLVTIKGYYVLKERTAWEQTEKCDSLVVTANYEKLVIQEGGQEDDQTINLNLENLSQVEKNILLNSNKNKPISLTLLVFIPERAAGAPVCYSRVEILRVEK